MEGFIFFWFTWSTWIFSTFILNKKNPYRFPLALISLITMILSAYSVQFFQYRISYASLFLWMISFAAFTNLSFSSLLNKSFRILIMTIAVATFHILSLIDPVWLIFEKTWMQAGSFAFLAILLFSHLKDRIFAVINSFFQGEFIYAALLQRRSIDYPIGSLSFFDSLVLGLLFTSIWSGVEYLRHSFQHHESKGRERPFI
ncbi:hypothetical protein [Fervidibacillus halotolerans]|uniref:Uncharacterized protein n=1 Tax=Fervidibacillus halotolerans TaxID=2980027 RepID=A0A9E8RZV6_9BACI|nr:hypothetical protein [Fervidibacillus halotolerans]WAA13773.1 hypothetical protein OE105_06645 [Fervidibacillus halotolerans]